MFLVVESEDAFKACARLTGALGRVQETIHSVRPSANNDPWGELNQTLGRATRDCQNAVRRELGVRGPAIPWDSGRYKRQNRRSDETSVDPNAKQDSADP